MPNSFAKFSLLGTVMTYVRQLGTSVTYDVLVTEFNEQTGEMKAQKTYTVIHPTLTNDQIEKAAFLYRSIKIGTQIYVEGRLDIIIQDGLKGYEVAFNVYAQEVILGDAYRQIEENGASLMTLQLEPNSVVKDANRQGNPRTYRVWTQNGSREMIDNNTPHAFYLLLAAKEEHNFKAYAVFRTVKRLAHLPGDSDSMTSYYEVFAVV